MSFIKFPASKPTPDKIEMTVEVSDCSGTLSYNAETCVNDLPRDPSDVKQELDTINIMICKLRDRARLLSCELIGEVKHEAWVQAAVNSPYKHPDIEVDDDAGLAFTETGAYVQCWLPVSQGDVFAFVGEEPLLAEPFDNAEPFIELVFDVLDENGDDIATLKVLANGDDVRPASAAAELWIRENYPILPTYKLDLSNARHIDPVSFRMAAG